MRPVESDRMVVMNPELFGLSGERNASTASVAYLFAKQFAAGSEGLAKLAVVGSAEIPGDLVSLNRIALEDAASIGGISVRGTGRTQDYVAHGLGRPVSYRTFSGKLTILGSVGYYADGPRMAIEACLHGMNLETLGKASELEEKTKRVNKELLSKIQASGLGKLRHVQ